MEASPLIKAHDHARAAADATHASNSTVAVNEHTKAAGEFANAAKNTTSVEALRTLRLLEEHHRRLSELVKLSIERPTSQSASEQESQNAEDEKPATAAAVTDQGAPSIKSEVGSEANNEKNPQTMPTLHRQRRYPSRDLGASIASNLASARGIRSKYRSQPLSPSVSNTDVPGNLELASRRYGSGSKSKMQDMLDNSDRPLMSPGRISRQSSAEPRKGDRSFDSSKTGDSTASSSDEGFSKFYSAFGSIINRISAPLAFAGLPLISEEPSEESAPTPEPPAQRRHRPKSSISTAAEPDLSRLYSKATLRAIARESQSANESFYVVPTSGHTVSYASILSFAGKEQRRIESSGRGDLGSLAEDPDEDDFVDARESQVPVSPGLKRRAGKIRSDKDLNNVVEELYLENQSLKDMLDKLSKRLHAFESMSQNSGMRLAESIRLMRPDSPVLVGAKHAGEDENLKKRNEELEEKLAAYTKQMEEMQKDYNRAQQYIARYRERWNQLKAGAKARRAAGGSGSVEVTDEGTSTRPTSSG